MPPIELLGPISQIETIAWPRAIRDIARIRKTFGHARWRKCKGVAFVRRADGTISRAEIHWYEAHGIGKRLLKVKRYLD